MAVKCLKCVEKEEAKHDSEDKSLVTATPDGTTTEPPVEDDPGSTGPITPAGSSASKATAKTKLNFESEFDDVFGDTNDQDRDLMINGKAYTPIRTWVDPPFGKGDGPIAPGVMVKMTTGTHTHTHTIHDTPPIIVY